MLRCLELAKNGRGRTYPNPMVGAVIVHQGRIIGEGWHQKAGEPHAEVNAIAAVKNKSHLKEVTIYVSLEPCSHYGKTPPCSDLIIASGIKKVVIGTVDPFAKVAGRGIRKLIQAGCEVQVGVLDKKCQFLNRRFFTFHQKKRPYIILKWAQTHDGYIAPLAQKDGEPVWISTQASQQLVHKWRSEEQAILVGTQTAIKDNPSLTTRLWQGPNPTRVVLDRNLHLPTDANLFDQQAKTIVFTAKKKVYQQNNLHYEPIDFTQNVPEQICDVLYRHNIQSLIVEGGQKTLQSFIDENLWDEARVFRGNKNFEKGIKSPILSAKVAKQTNDTGDFLNYYYHDKNTCF